MIPEIFVDLDDVFHHSTRCYILTEDIKRLVDGDDNRCFTTTFLHMVG